MQNGGYNGFSSIVLVFSQPDPRESIRKNRDIRKRFFKRGNQLCLIPDFHAKKDRMRAVTDKSADPLLESVLHNRNCVTPLVASRSLVS